MDTDSEHPMIGVNLKFIETVYKMIPPEKTYTVANWHSLFRLKTLNSIINADQEYQAPLFGPATYQLTFFSEKVCLRQLFKELQSHATQQTYIYLPFMDKSGKNRSTNKLETEIIMLPHISTENVSLLLDILFKDGADVRSTNFKFIHEISTENDNWFHDFIVYLDLNQRKISKRCEKKQISRSSEMNLCTRLLLSLSALGDNQSPKNDGSPWIDFITAAKQSILIKSSKPLTSLELEKLELLFKKVSTTPLHHPYLFKFLPNSTKILQEMIKKFPNWLAIENRNGEIPLHIFSKYACFETSIISQLVEGWKDGRIAQDINGFMPLHFAIASKSCPETIQLLADGIRSCGVNPLHVALEHSPVSIDVVKIILEIFEARIITNKTIGLAVDTGQPDILEAILKTSSIQIISEENTFEIVKNLADLTNIETRGTIFAVLHPYLTYSSCPFPENILVYDVIMQLPDGPKYVEEIRKKVNLDTARFLFTAIEFSESKELIGFLVKSFPPSRALFLNSDVLRGVSNFDQMMDNLEIFFDSFPNCFPDIFIKSVFTRGFTDDLNKGLEMALKYLECGASEWNDVLKYLLSNRLTQIHHIETVFCCHPNIDLSAKISSLSILSYAVFSETGFYISGENHQQILKLIISKKPDLVSSQSEKLSIPLHFACYKANPYAIITLLEVDEKGAEKFDLRHFLPFHYYCISKARNSRTVEDIMSSAAFAALVSANPSALTEETGFDYKHFTPLHFAIYFDNLPLIKEIVSYAPDAIYKTHYIGKSPICLSLNAKIKTIQFLNALYGLDYLCTTPANLSSVIESHHVAVKLIDKVHENNHSNIPWFYLSDFILLKYLDVANIKMSEKEFKKMVRAIIGSKTLRVLSMTNNNYSTASISRLVATHGSLKEISVINAGFTFKHHILSLASLNPSIVKIEIDNNEYPLKRPNHSRFDLSKELKQKYHHIGITRSIFFLNLLFTHYFPQEIFESILGYLTRQEIHNIQETKNSEYEYMDTLQYKKLLDRRSWDPNFTLDSPSPPG